jgi:uncharacterized protein YaiL (DUF2058 family)
MAIRNPLQEQLLKAGLVNKNKVDQVARAQQKAREGKPQKGEAAVDAEAVDATRLAAERAERDRQLEAQRRAEREAAERTAQVRQIIEAHRVKPGDDLDYRFTDGSVIRSLRIGAAQRDPLARGALAIARLGESFALVPRDTAQRLREIEPAVLAVDHSIPATAAAEPAAEDSDEAFYSRFQVPDDLQW